MRISALILNFNGLEDTRRALRSLLAVEDLDIVPMVIDNGSARDEAALLRVEFPAVFVERSEENLGFSRGVNRLARRAMREGSTHLLLMNSDAWIPPGQRVLERLAETLDTQPSLAAAGPAICNPDGTLQSAGYEFSMWWPISRALRRSGTSARPPAFISGSFMLIDAARFAELGGFDPDFFLYGEDLDFALRARFAGFGVTVVPDVAVSHTRGASSRIFSNRYVYTALRGNLILIKKHARWYQLPGAALASAAASFGLALFALRNGNARAAGAVAKAWNDFFGLRWSGLTGEALTPVERPCVADLPVAS